MILAVPVFDSPGLNCLLSRIIFCYSSTMTIQPKDNVLNVLQLFCIFTLFSHLLTHACCSAHGGQRTTQKSSLLPLCGLQG